MDKLGLNEVRERFLKFFKSKDHLTMPSFPLVPKNDPSLLLINAGMAPLKPYFTGKEVPPKKRVATCQKCIRTPDIDIVGTTARHATFFEMLGNFSFGDYFKKEAIAWGWEFVTEDLKMPVNRLWVSIYKDDDEAFEIWNKDIGLPPERIVRLGKEDNFWEHGLGPCGPCSEIYFDRGEEYGCGSENCAVGCDCDRYIEFWNLVFTQFDKDEKGNYNTLPNPNIDTGMGLERLAAILQEVESIYEVDTIKNILQEVSNISGIKYNLDKKRDISLRVITDHIRSTTFMISDGILPSNEGRGYVLRRLLRRAARHGKLLGIKGTFLWELAQKVIDESKSAYPELEENKNYIQKVIKIEEERFNETVDQGLNILNQYIDKLKKNEEKVLSGENAFKLYDTYGFPIDLTIEILKEQDLDVDVDKFNEEMEAQRERARSARDTDMKEAWGTDAISELDKFIKTDFVGYNLYEEEAEVLAVINNNELTRCANKGTNVIIILDATPFYGESGGQVGDTGTIENGQCEITVDDTQKTNDGKVLHIGTIKKGQICVGDKVYAKIDIERRLSIARNHTATHLLHKALKTVLGDHVAQSGSLVASDRLRFDFSHFAALKEEELKEIERIVNNAVLNNYKISVMEKNINEAKKMGATALFGEKYGETVRVVKIDDFSIELCGGCHIDFTSQIGTFKIISENGVAAGIRRIEAVTGKAFLKYFNEKENLLRSLSGVLKVNENELFNKAKLLIEDLKKSQKEIESLRSKLVKGSLNKFIDSAQEIRGISIVTARIDDLDMNGLRDTGDKIRNKLDNSIVVLATAKNNRVNFVAMASKKAVDAGIHAGNIIREVAKIAGGGGGGRPDMAQAGGKDVSKIDEALKKVYSLVENQV